MGSDIENLNMELIQAQILLCASHDLFEGIMREVMRRRLLTNSVTKNDFDQEISSRLVKFSHRDEDIRRALLRLEKLGAPPKKSPAY